MKLEWRNTNKKLSAIVSLVMAKKLNALVYFQIKGSVGNTIKSILS